MKMFRAVVLFFTLEAVSRIPTSSAINYTEIVQTTFGPVRGEELTYEGTNYKAFKGIPYAAPPTGNLKFKAPQPPEAWSTVKNTTSFGKVCLQQSTSKPSGEDCLSLNVYTQSLDEKDLKPVFFYIHGGGYQQGSGSDCGPEYLLQKDIVVVSINYRLGALGFLSTNTSDATGNWGMKDQVAALTWVQANIAKFGGDPKNVALYGVSAGGSSVHFHLFSPLSKGLFHKAISSSGSVANYWALNTAEQAQRFSSNLARLLGASEDDIKDPQKRVEFLRAADPQAMTKLLSKVLGQEDTTHLMFNPFPFSPVVEFTGTEGAFLMEDPKKLLAEGKFSKVPMMMGANNLEAAGVYTVFLKKDVKNFTSAGRKEMELNVCQILTQPLKDAVIAKNECPQIAKQIRDAYFDGKGFDSSEPSFIDLFGDLYFVKDIYNSQRMHARYAENENPLYNYNFAFDGEWNLIKKQLNITLPGAVHAEETIYIFRPGDDNLPVLPASSPEVITKDRMMSFISNFLKYGDPTPSTSELVPVKWELSKGNETNVMIIDKNLKMEREFSKTRMGLWESLDEKYGIKFGQNK